MPQHIYYEKTVVQCTTRQFTAFLHTTQRDYHGLWPVSPDLNLEICSVSCERFEDSSLYAGWVLYTTPVADMATGLTVNPDYAAATIEVYELPMDRTTVYFTDGQEPGDFRTSCIGTPFVHFADYIKAGVGALTLTDVVHTQPALPVLTSPVDILIVKWLLAVPVVSIPIIAQRLQLSPGTVRAHRKKLRTMGYAI